MEHKNPRESNYQLFVEKYDLEKKLNNKEKSALHACYVIKNIVDKKIRVHFSYHAFLHGEDGDSEETLKENRKGAIYFSFYDDDITFENEHTPEQLHYDNAQLAMISLKYTKLLNYINKMVIEKYPSDNQYADQRKLDSREKFYEKLCELKYQKILNNKVVAINYSRITEDNFSQFLDILLTEKLIKEFEIIINKDLKDSNSIEKSINNHYQRFKL